MNPKTASSPATRYLLLHQIVLNRLVCDCIPPIIGIPVLICCCCTSPRILPSNQADQACSLLKNNCLERKAIYSSQAHFMTTHLILW
jgi:hypothetical protein